VSCGIFQNVVDRTTQLTRSFLFLVASMGYLITNLLLLVVFGVDWHSGPNHNYIAPTHTDTHTLSHSLTYSLTHAGPFRWKLLKWFRSPFFLARSSCCLFACMYVCICICPVRLAISQEHFPSISVLETANFHGLFLPPPPSHLWGVAGKVGGLCALILQIHGPLFLNYAPQQRKGSGTS